MAASTVFARSPAEMPVLVECFASMVTQNAVPSLAVSAGISERRRTKGALRDSEARLRTLTDRLPIAVFPSFSVHRAR